MLSNRFSEWNPSLWKISCKTHHFSKYIGRIFEVVQPRNLVRPNNISILNFYFHLWMATELIMLWSLEMVNIFAIAGTPRPSSEIIIPLQPFITSSAVGNCLVPSLFLRFTNSISLSCLSLFLVFTRNIDNFGEFGLVLASVSAISLFKKRMFCNIFWVMYIGVLRCNFAVTLKNFFHMHYYYSFYALFLYVKKHHKRVKLKQQLVVWTLCANLYVD